MPKPEGKRAESLGEFLGLAGSDFNVLEEAIDIEVQKEYSLMAHILKKEPDFPYLRQKYTEDTTDLFDEDFPELKKKRMLVTLATIPEPAAYRAIEAFVKLDSPLKKWATIALQQSRMLLQTTLLDDPAVFISSGLGGRGSLLRFFVVLIHTAPDGLETFQLNTLRAEVETSIRKVGGIVEDMEHRSAYTSLLLLFPIHANLSAIFKEIITECNQYGSFLAENLILTNIKKLPHEEIMQLLAEPSGSARKAGRRG